MNWVAHKGFCFTGKGMLHGTLITRDRLESFIQRNAGYIVKKPGSSSDILVASRTDTTKAEAALNVGARVISYDEFWQLCGIKRDADLSNIIGDAGDPPDDDGITMREAERQAAAARVAAKREAHARNKAAMEQAEAEIEGWGMF